MWKYTIITIYYSGRFLLCRDAGIYMFTRACHELEMFRLGTEQTRCPGMQCTIIRRKIPLFDRLFLSPLGYIAAL